VRTPEGVIEQALVRQGVRLQPGSRYRILLDTAVLNNYGRLDRGPHTVGRLDAVDRYRFDIKGDAEEVHRPRREGDAARGAPRRGLR
jgi:hypothetical protein